MKFTETNLDSYAAPLSASEDQRCKNAISMIRDALRSIGYSEGTRQIEKMILESYAYSLQMTTTTGRSVYLFVQGSYANNTNVKTESDVDVAVVLESTFRTNYRIGQTDANYGFSSASYAVTSFKDDVERALKNYFNSGVERGNKSIKIHGNSYRVDADSVPCMRYRDYTQDYLNEASNYIGGILIRADDGEVIVNYPEQHIKNGRVKNTNTDFFYKKMVRIMKKMRYLMQDNHVSAADGVSSFALESLLWNVPDSWYLEYKVHRKVFAFSQLISILISNQGSLGIYKEANGIKPLCPDVQSIAKMQLFLTQLNAFYDYD